MSASMGWTAAAPPWRIDPARSRQDVFGSAGRALPSPREERAVHARSITVHGAPENIDAGIKFVTTEVAPMLAEIEGCRGLSLLVDRATGRCIVTSSWEDAESMRAGNDMLRPVRERGRDVLGGTMAIDEWQVEVMHRSHHGECCRVSWLTGDLEAMAASFRMAILPELEATAGFCSASLFVDRASGMGCATTVWQSREAMEASRRAADEMRRRAAGDSAGTIVEVHEFDLAYAHLHVPEMA
jgi:quinol monooxygenase YgiN